MAKIAPVSKGTEALDVSGKSNLLSAVAKNDANDFRNLLRLCAKDSAAVNFVDFSKRSALSLACILGSENIVSCLLKNAHVQIDSQDIVGFTPLMHAAQRGYSNIVEQLLSKGAKYRLTDVRGNTAIILAARRNQITCLEVLARYVRSVEDWKVIGECDLSAEEWAMENEKLEAAEFIKKRIGHLRDSTDCGNDDVDSGVGDSDDYLL